MAMLTKHQAHHPSLNQGGRQEFGRRGAAICGVQNGAAAESCDAQRHQQAQWKEQRPLLVMPAPAGPALGRLYPPRGRASA